MKNVIAALALAVSLPAMGDAGDHDVGVAGVDYEKLIDPVEITVEHNNAKVRKNCGKLALGCAITKKRVFRDTVTKEITRTEYVCNVYMRIKSDDITVRHEMKHCYGWAHEEMPYEIQRKSSIAQRKWLDTAHENWFPTNFSPIK